MEGFKNILKVAGSHEGCLSWWRSRSVDSAIVLHVDMHHDLLGNSRDQLNCGNFLRHALSEGCVNHLYWVVPVSRAFLAGSHAHVFIQTLPEDFRNCILNDSGRWHFNNDDFNFEIRAFDDLPSELNMTGCEVSYDLDFHYHLDLAGPTIDPITWLTQFTNFMNKISPAGVFLAISLDDGYVPPTYRPVAVWLEECLNDCSLPKWSDALWSNVRYAEECRVKSEVKQPDCSLNDSNLPHEIKLFFNVWNAYLRGQYEEVVNTMRNLPPILRFIPSDELLVETQHEKKPAAAILERVKRAEPFFVFRKVQK